MAAEPDHKTPSGAGPAPDTPEASAERDIGTLLLPLVVLALVAVFYVETLDFPTSEDVGPAGVPYLWMAFTAFFCVVLIVQALRRTLPPDPKPGRIGFVIVFAGWLVMYLAAIESVGYFVSTFVFLVVSMYVLTYRNALIMVAVATVWVVFAYFVFAEFLFIPLPTGPLARLLLG